MIGKEVDGTEDSAWASLCRVGEPVVMLVVCVIGLVVRMSMFPPPLCFDPARLAFWSVLTVLLLSAFRRSRSAVAHAPGL